ncbi:MAG: hypothetical protein HZB77_05865, partial [Chloroflexi bacterium]|nr:hypothetical protein [Chloroflexota bacterium]
MPFPTRAEYESLIYELAEKHSEIKESTLRLYSTSALTAIMEGEVLLSNGLKLHVMEVLDFKDQRIVNYSYTIYRGEEKVRWYDPQPHPDNPALAKTFPHHYHADPDIKHNRLPAHAISFTEPNLETLISDCLKMIN